MLKQLMNNLMKLWIDATEAFLFPGPLQSAVLRKRLGRVKNISIALTLRLLLNLISLHGLFLLMFSNNLS